MDSYLRDAAGNTVYNAGSTLANPYKFIRIAGQDYTVSNAAPSSSESEHWMHGVSLNAHGARWDGELAASIYDQKKDISRSATLTNGLDSGLGAVKPGGQVTYADGTGWESFDLRGRWRSDDSDTHIVSFGAHRDLYKLASVTYGTAAAPIADWTVSESGTLNTNSFGKTQTEAVYLQDEWRVAPLWTLMLGGRQEWWRAFDGSNFNAANVLLECGAERNHQRPTGSGNEVAVSPRTADAAVHTPTVMDRLWAEDAGHCAAGSGRSN